MSRYTEIMGRDVEDKSTGFKGRIVGVCEYFNGCVQYLVRPTVGKDGKRPDAEWIDDAYCEIKGSGISKYFNPKPIGGPNEKERPTNKME